MAKCLYPPWILTKPDGSGNDEGLFEYLQPVGEENEMGEAELFVASGRPGLRRSIST
jgi:hypothetical protein